MENNKKKGTTNFDQLFGTKDPSTASSYSTSIFGSIFPPPPSTVGGRDIARKQDAGCKNFGAPGNFSNKGESSGGISNMNNNNDSSNYQNETVLGPSGYFSSSIYYGGQENYSPRTRTTESHHVFKKDKEDDDPNDDSNSASRGNWWQGSLYY